MKRSNCNCEVCKKGMYRKPSHIARNKGGMFFCSMKCWREWKENNTTAEYSNINCSTCGKEMKRLSCECKKSKNGKYFCNMECKKNYHFVNKNKGKSLIGERPLSEFTHRKGSNKYTNVRVNAKVLTANREQICTNCGWADHVEVCHIKDICEFSEDTRIKEINADTNLVLLCPNCHWEFDDWKDKVKIDNNLQCPIKLTSNKGE